MAVCVEEHCNGEGITILVISNTGDLSAVVQEFMTLAKILEQAARRGRYPDQVPKCDRFCPLENSKAEDIEALFRQVVVLDLYRILSLLRSRHGETWKTAGRPALIT